MSRFAHLTKAALVRLGATPRGESKIYAFVVDTVAGPLKITPHESWIACRFDEPGRAAKAIEERPWLPRNLNRYSGKWNWHFGAGEPAAQVASFEDSVQSLLAHALPEQGSLF